MLMTDIGLPGMSGLELALEALSRQPSLRVIFMTGHSVIDGQDDHEQLQSAILLTKPFDERGLAAAIGVPGPGLEVAVSTCRPNAPLMSAHSPAAVEWATEAQFT